MTETVTVGELAARFLERCGAGAAFGVISIHNMPILDAIARRNALRFVPARGEAGAASMADAHARVSGGLGVCITSTGTAAGNAMGGLVEAHTAGTPLLHLTGQVETAYLDRGRGYIHEHVPQPVLLAGAAKQVLRVWTPDQALGVLRRAVLAATTPPCGPVSVEIPIDVQEALVALPEDLEPLPVPAMAPPAAGLDRLAERLAGARRPLLWLGGGARGAAAAVRRLADLGFGIVTSVQGRGILPESDPRTLGAFNLSPPVEAFYQSCDALLVAGSRLRGNETLKYTLKLPRPLYQIDIDPAQDSRAYPADLFVPGDAAAALDGLADRLAGRLAPDPGFHADLAAARAAAWAAMAAAVAPYDRLLEALVAAVPDDVVWVRDVTISNSTWGNRAVPLSGPRDGVHALGGGIGMGLSMGIGAALAAGGRKTVALVGDGGIMLQIGELATAVQENADLAVLLMNDRGYGVIRNIQDAKYQGRRAYADLHTPDFAALAASLGLAHARIDTLSGIGPALAREIAKAGPRLIEVDMAAIGPFARPFAGPPVRK
ncbi:MAG: thiamine pyrophosphate-binding protein [Thalassobaculales bacterium]